MRRVNFEVSNVNNSNATCRINKPVSHANGRLIVWEFEDAFNTKMRMRGKKNLIIKLVVSLVISYVLFRAKWQSASFGTSVSENPHQVWEFVSDLNNAKLLNPSM